MNYWTIILQLAPILVLFYLYVKRRHSYWSKRGLTGPNPTFLVGNIFSLIRNGLTTTELEWQKKFGKIYGTYIGLAPSLTIADPELIKQVLVKDFPLFMNRRKLNFEHEIWSKNLFLSQGDSWKKIRSITSPTFTSGKLRGMNHLMRQCVDKLTSYFDKLSSSSDSVMDTKEVIAGFTIDVIASTSFATETNTNDDRSKKSPFVYHGLNLFRSHPLVLLSLFTMPRFFNHILNIKIPFPLKSFNFFRDLAKSVVTQRRENSKSGAKRNDLVQLLMDSYVYEADLDNTNFDKLTASADKDDHSEQKESQSNGKQISTSNKKTLNENEIIAQCMIFFVAGFETTASTISHCVYELAINPEAQNRLKNELDQKLEGLDSASDEYYETVTSHIPYLDAVIKETLRKYPPVTRLERRAAQEGYKLGGIPLEKDMTVQISTYGVHHNAEFYPDPERYNPDRFMPENKHLLVPYTYLPFGQGPRNCVGMRFAYQEIKLCLAKIVPKFEFSPTADTPIPLTFAKNSLLLTSNAIPLKVSKR